MKPYLLVTGDFVKTGGMDRANFALADYLARQGAAVHLVAHRVDPELLAYPQVTWHRVPQLANSDLLSSFGLNWVGRLWASHIQQQGGRVLVNGGNCNWGDINWVHYVHGAYRPATPENYFRQLKTNLTHHYFRKTEKHIISSAKVVIANSVQTQRHLIQHCAVPPQSIRSIDLGIDPAVFYPAPASVRLALRQQLGWPSDRAIVLFMGALSDRRKGFDTLFAAWQQLCTNPTWTADLVVVGQGAELSQWQQRSQQVGLGDRLQFLGFRHDVPDLLRAADCLVSPTRYEPYGLGVHEALCCGLPAIVSATAGVADRYPEQLTALLLPDPDNSADLATRLCHWQTHATHYRNIVLATLSQKLRNYTWDDMAKQILTAV